MICDVHIPNGADQGIVAQVAEGCVGFEAENLVTQIHIVTDKNATCWPVCLLVPALVGPGVVRVEKPVSGMDADVKSVPAVLAVVIGGSRVIRQGKRCQHGKRAHANEAVFDSCFPATHPFARIPDTFLFIVAAVDRGSQALTVKHKQSAQDNADVLRALSFAGSTSLAR
jgi:hypothetical protein